MSSIVNRLISLIIGYVIGNIVMGYVFGKIKHVNLQKEGSGNIGTTNTLRVLGPGYAAFTLLFDVLKCTIAGFIVFAIFNGKDEAVYLYMVYACVGTILGHDFPFVLHFKGGKGVAATLGLIIAICPICTPIAMAVFLTLVIITRYVSLGSIVAITVFFIEYCIFAYKGMLKIQQPYILESCILIGFIAALSIFLHRGNIVRLLNHSENKLSFHKKEKTEDK